MRDQKGFVCAHCTSTGTSPPFWKIIGFNVRPVPVVVCIERSISTFFFGPLEVVTLARKNERLNNKLELFCFVNVCKIWAVWVGLISHWTLISLSHMILIWISLFDYDFVWSHVWSDFYSIVCSGMNHIFTPGMFSTKEFVLGSGGTGPEKSKCVSWATLL